MKSLRLSQFLLLLATILSGWLTYESITASIGCGAGGDCSAVVTSPWAKFLGIPIALMGLFTYLGLLILTLCRPFHNRTVMTFSATLCLLVIGSALWFTALQAFIIRSFCPYCCAIHALGTLASLLFLRQLYTQFQDNNRPPPVLLLLILSFSMVAGMVAIQFLSPAPQQSVVVSTEHHRHGAEDTPLLFSLTEEQQPIFQGEITDIPLEVMTLGAESEDPIELGYLYDWTCEYCIALHQMLCELQSSNAELTRHYQITLLPYSHTPEGRSLHRLIAAVKHSDPASYEVLQLELHHGILPANAETIRTRVEELVTTTLTIPEYTAAEDVAQQQLSHNQKTLHLNTVPQLFGIYSALSGNPTKQELLDFLEKAAREQNTYQQ